MLSRPNFFSAIDLAWCRFHGTVPAKKPMGIKSTEDGYTFPSHRWKKKPPRSHEHHIAPNPGATPSMGKWTPKKSPHSFASELGLWPKKAMLRSRMAAMAAAARRARIERHQGGGIPIESETPYFRLAGWWFGTWLLFSISHRGCHGMSSFPLSMIFNNFPI